MKLIKKLLEELKIEWRAFKALAKWTFSYVYIKEWYVLSLPFDVVNMLFGLLVWYYYGLMFGKESIPILQAYGGSFISYLIIGVVVNSLLTHALWSFVSCINVALTSTLYMGATRLTLPDYFRMAGIPFSRWMLAKIVLDYVGSFIRTSIYFIGGILIFGIDFPRNADVLGAFIALLLGLLALTGISMIGASLLLVVRRAYGKDPLTWLISLLASIASGVYFPPEILPESLRIASLILPQTYTLRALRLCLLAGKPLLMNISDLSALLMSVTTLPLGILFLKLGLKRYEERGLAF
ncbi:MAG: ABC transporter permease [Thermoproteales archaeon]|nr:ABC transporter permease [Thermoproteales archaeon]